MRSRETVELGGVMSIEDAKTAETRQRQITKAVVTLRDERAVAAAR